MGKTTIETLQVEVQDESLQAANGLEKLKNTLSQLKIMARGGIGLTSVIHQLEKLDTSAKKINGDGVRKLQTLTTALNALSSVGKPNISKSTANQIEAIGKATKSLSGIDFTPLRNLADSLKPLEGLQKTNLGNTVNNLKKVPEALSGIRNVGQADTDAIKRLVETLKPLSEMGSISNFASALNKLRQLPEIAKSLEGMDMTRFEQQIIRVTNAVRPLATEMDKIARGFSSFPERIQRVITGMEKLESKSNTVSGAMSKFYSSLRSMRSTFTTLYFSISRITDKLGEWFNESAEYVEALNLFNVTMRDGTDAAFEYAESVSNLMGIDIKEWMNYQGSFQNLVTGYEVSTEKARVMSKGLTQLAYDLSSVYNVSVETAFTKLQSAMSGQVKSLKVWGVDVSVASMKQYMLAKGITASWLSLNTAQKAILRYNYIMEKTVNMQGDLARTLVTPSNAMRIFKAQCVQLWRALGNIVSVLATKVIPYMQAFVEEATDAANELAVLWGFELPKIDYSGLDSTGVTENLEETEDALTSLKRSFIGMDEINALNGNATASGSLLPEDLGLEIYDYDFLSNSVKVSDEIREKVRGFVTFLKDTVTFIYEHGKLILGIITAIVGIKVGVDLFNLFSSFGSVIRLIDSKGLDLIGAFLDGFGLIKVTGGNMFQSLVGGFKNLYNKIPPVMKKLIGAAGLVYGFKLAQDGAYDLAKALGSDSNEGLGKSIVSLVSGGAMAIAGGAMIGGPIGAVIGACVALAGALVGVAKAQTEMRLEMLKTEYYDIQGTKLSELKKSLNNYFDSLDFDKQSEWIGKMESAQSSYDDTRDAYDKMWHSIADKPVFDASDIENLTSAFNDLADAANAVNDANIGSLMASIKTGIEMNITDALTDRLGSLLDKIEDAQLILGKKISNLSSQYQSILNDISNNGGTVSSEQREQLKSLRNDLAKFTLSKDTSTERWNIEINDALNNAVNAGTDKDSVLSNIQDLMGDRDTYLDNLKTKYAADMNTLQQLIELDRTEFGGKLGFSSADLETLKNSYEAQLDVVKSKYNDVLEQVIATYEANALNWNAYHYDNGLLDFLDTVGAGIGGLFGWAGLKDGNGDTGWDHNANKTLADEQKELLEELKKFLLPGYATGGFPEDGLFMANSRELVGKFTNGKTAVANNNQIIEGIKQGVKEANSESGAVGGDWIIQLVDTDGSLKSETIITAAERKNRRDGKTIIPVGT